MKYSLVLLLCLPLVGKLAFDSYHLVLWELRGHKEGGRLSPKDQQKQLDDAQLAVQDFSDLQATVVLAGSRPSRPKLPADPQLKELADAVKAHAEALHDAQVSLKAFRTKDRTGMKHKYGELWDLASSLEEEAASLKEKLAQLDPATTKTDPQILKQIDECQKKWEGVTKDQHYSTRTKVVLGFLKHAKKVAALLGKGDDEMGHLLKLADFQDLDHAATAYPEELARLAKQQALLAARPYWPDPLSYDDEILVAAPEMEPAKWFLHKKAFADKKTISIRVDGDTKKGKYVEQDPKLQFTYARVSYTDPVQPGDIKLLPTPKSVLAHAFNEVRKRSAKPKPLDIEKALWDEYQKWAKKNDALESKLLKKDSAFVMDELKAHYPKEWQKVSSLVEIAQSCKTLFR